MKVLHSSFVYNTEKNLWKKTSFFEIILTEKVATYGGKDNILVRKRKISNERLAKTKQTDQMPLCLSSLLHTLQIKSWMMIMNTRPFSQRNLLPKNVLKLE